MTTISFDEARRRRWAAGQLVPYIAAGRIGDWPLHIPARQDDPDTILDDALLALDEMTRRAEQAEAALADAIITWLQCTDAEVRASALGLPVNTDATVRQIEALTGRHEAALNRVTADQRHTRA